MAIRINKYIEDKLDIFESMVSIDSERNGGKQIPLPLLINMTFRIDNRHVARNVASNIQLVNASVKTNFLSEDTNAMQARSETGHDVNELFFMGRLFASNTASDVTRVCSFMAAMASPATTPPSA